MAPWCVSRPVARCGLVARLASVALVGSLGLAGVLDAWRVVSGVSTVTVFDLAGSGLPYSSWVVEQVNDRWYIAE